MPTCRSVLLPLVALSALALVSCGGGGGSGDSGGGGGGGGGIGTSDWIRGNYQPATNYSARCAAPRSGTSDLSGSKKDENNWLRSWTHETYLWYSEVTDVDPSLYSTPDYFDLMKTFATTPSGADKDRFHFTYSTAEWTALSQAGEDVGYGVQWALTQLRPPRAAYIAFVEPNIPAANASANLTRGVSIETIDGVSLINDNTRAGVDVLNAGLSPSKAGETHAFGVLYSNGTRRTVTLTASKVTHNPVPIVKVLATPSGSVGYVLFNDHLATSEPALVNAINTLKAASVTDLILDIRYNGGGYLEIASELAYMIAGPTATAGKTFEQLQFNDRYPTTNPITGRALEPMPFLDRTRGFTSSLPSGAALPTLNLGKVYVLTGTGTCSASEAIINGLRGADVQVIQVGSTTCGKPYGFYPADNCGTTYFSIQFRGINAKGFGEYPDGFSPSGSPTTTTQLPGCSVSDDFAHQLGDTTESTLLAALSYMKTSGATCAASGFAPQAADRDGVKPREFVLPKPAWRENRILR